MECACSPIATYVIPGLVGLAFVLMSFIAVSSSKELRRLKAQPPGRPPQTDSQDTATR